MPEMFYQQLRRQRRRAALSVTAFVLTLCLLPLALIAFRRYPLLGTALLAGCAAMVLACYRVRRVPPDVPELYAVPILADDPAARLAACGVEQISEYAQVLFATDGRLHARVLVLECDDFDAQRLRDNRRRANQTIHQMYHVGQEISISDSYTQFRVNLVLAARDSGELRTWVSAQPEHLLQRAEPIVQAAVAREQGVLLFPALHQWVTPAEAHVYETAAKLLTELFLEN